MEASSSWSRTRHALLLQYSAGKTSRSRGARLRWQTLGQRCRQCSVSVSQSLTLLVLHIFSEIFMTSWPLPFRMALMHCMRVVVCRCRVRARCCQTSGKDRFCTFGGPARSVSPSYSVAAAGRAPASVSKAASGTISIEPKPTTETEPAETSSEPTAAAA